MSKLLQASSLGVALGAASWFVVPLVSNKFEPYDSDTGLLIGQALMAAAAFYFGFVHRIINIVVFIVGAYIGLNLYPYLFGGSEQRAWASLGLLVSTLLCVLPLIAGIFGIIAKYGKMKYNKTLQPTAPKDGAPVER
jgi:hypothetical protein